MSGVPQSEALEDPFPPDIHFPLSLPLTSDLTAEEEDEEGVEDEERGQEGPRWDMAAVCCDHNYTVEDCVRSRRRCEAPQENTESPPPPPPLPGHSRRVEQLEEQLAKLRRKMKTMQQKCRRRERQLKRLKAAIKYQGLSKASGAACGTAAASVAGASVAAFGDEYVILPKHIYLALKDRK